MRALYKRFGGEEVLAGVDFDLAAHQTLAILGRSGSGKTTLLKVIAGLESSDSGRLALGGEDLAGVPPQRRGILYLYQEPLLFPHLDVTANLAFGLELRRVDKREKMRRVGEMLAELELEAHARKKPHQLSGGQRQRVAFGRALVVNPRLLLLDEPFGSLDGETRARMQSLLRSVAARHRITAIFVTHDLKEAILMGDRVGHLRAGRLHVFADLAELVADPQLGVGEEIRFWSSLFPEVKR